LIIVLRIVKLLLKFKAEVNIQDSDGNTALIYACDNKRVEVIKLLMEAGADPKIQNMLKLKMENLSLKFRVPFVMESGYSESNWADAS